MSVFGNIAYALHARRTEKKIIKEKVVSIAGELSISHLLERGIRHLSGGELQRVALARTLITSPRLLLLDEPMASIDASLKDDIKRLLRRLNGSGLTIIHVTHDYREAVSLASMVGVIHNGRIIQEGKPDEVFRKPVNKFVARYSGIRNFFRVKFNNKNGIWSAISKNNIVIELTGNSYPDEGLLIVRSDDIKISLTNPYHEAGNCFKGAVTEILPSEFGMEITVDTGELFFIDISADAFRQQSFKELSEVWISFSPDACVVLNSKV
jgi:ABC-type sugar transport system ATPase subunit